MPRSGVERYRGSGSKSVSVKKDKKSNPQVDYDYYDESRIIGVGSYCIWRENVRKKTPDKRIVGFVRPKKQK